MTEKKNFSRVATKIARVPILALQRVGRAYLEGARRRTPEARAVKREPEEDWTR
jgi:hypothetical protein